MLLLWIGLGLICTRCCTDATLLAASRLESCVQTSASTASDAAANNGMQCAQRFVVTMTVQNGQNATESLVTYSLTKAEDDAGNVYDLLDTMEITLAKSTVNLQYPLVYERNFNNRPFEIVRTHDSSGRSFNPLTNPCIDDASLDGACGWMLNEAGTRVPYSNGFCCRCNLDDYFAASGTGSPTRANLDCALFSSSNGQSAHCLRMHPLWLSAFSIGAPQVQYTIDVAVRRCRSAAASSASNATAASAVSVAADAAAAQCVWDLVKVGPASPGACQRFTGLPGWSGQLVASPTPAISASVLAASTASLGATATRSPATTRLPTPALTAMASASAAAAGCDVWASLEGDFAAFDSPPELSSKYLFVPLSCDDFSVCGNRTLEDSGRWLLVDKYRTTTGSECDKIGVAYSAFQTQGSRCQVPVSTCLRNQLEDLYQADAAAERAGRVGSYFLKYQAMGPYTTVNVQSPSTAKLVFGTTRFQKTVVTLVVDAASVRWVQRVAPGRITAASVPTFEAMSRDGLLTVAVESTGDVRSLFTVSVQCTGSVQPLTASQVTLQAPPAAGYQAVLTFALHTGTTAASSYACVVSLQDGLYRQTDSRTVLFNTTATVQTAGEQGGSPGPSAASGGATSDTIAAPIACKDRCSSWNLVCAVSYKCYSIVGGWAGALAGLALYGLLAWKFPFIFLAPCRMLSSAMCGGCGGGSSSGSSSLTRRNTHQTAAAAAKPAHRGRQRTSADHDGDGSDSEGDAGGRRRISGRPQGPRASWVMEMMQLLLLARLRAPAMPQHGGPEEIPASAPLDAGSASSGASHPRDRRAVPSLPAFELGHGHGSLESARGDAAPSPRPAQARRPPPAAASAVAAGSSNWSSSQQRPARLRFSLPPQPAYAADLPRYDGAAVGGGAGGHPRDVQHPRQTPPPASLLQQLSTLLRLLPAGSMESAARASGGTEPARHHRDGSSMASHSSSLDRGGEPGRVRDNPLYARHGRGVATAHARVADLHLGSVTGASCGDEVGSPDPAPEKQPGPHALLRRTTSPRRAGGTVQARGSVVGYQQPKRLPDFGASDECGERDDEHTGATEAGLTEEPTAWTEASSGEGCQ